MLTATDGGPVLLSALLNGQPEVVEAIGEFLFEAREGGLLTNEEFFDALAARQHVGGVSALEVGLMNGHAPAVRAWGEWLGRAQAQGWLTASQVEQLLSPTMMQWAGPHARAAFAELVGDLRKRGDISEELAARLLGKTA